MATVAIAAYCPTLRNPNWPSPTIMWSMFIAICAAFRRSQKEDIHRRACRRKRNLQNDDFPSRPGWGIVLPLNRARTSIGRIYRMVCTRHLVVTRAFPTTTRATARLRVTNWRVSDELVDRLLARAVAAIKADDVSLKLQNEFNEKSTHPLDTKQVGRGSAVLFRLSCVCFPLLSGSNIHHRNDR